MGWPTGLPRRKNQDAAILSWLSKEIRGENQLRCLPQLLLNTLNPADVVVGSVGETGAGVGVLLGTDKAVWKMFETEVE